ncbi:MAG TPA: type II toxin-antitoxin system VapC family toxin [Acetobacteraceae bacterium]|nr:type II toxin-antitoxin system VapC family toxin [Acetobacteraceae bacterium]
MTSYRTMLDTNIVSDLIRNPQGRAAKRLHRHGEQGICVSIITAAELRYGAARRQSDRLLRRIEVVLSMIDVLPFEVPADADYGSIRAALEAAGRTVGPTDLFIAAHARSMRVTLVTHNTAEFRRVPGLTVENWLEP